MQIGQDYVKSTVKSSLITVRGEKGGFNYYRLARIVICYCYFTVQEEKREVVITADWPRLC